MPGDLAAGAITGFILGSIIFLVIGLRIAVKEHRDGHEEGYAEGFQMGCQAHDWYWGQVDGEWLCAPREAWIPLRKVEKK